MTSTSTAARPVPSASAASSTTPTDTAAEVSGCPANASPKHVPGGDTGRITGVALRPSECGDQIVVSVANAPASMGYTVSYQDDFAELASGRPISLRGGVKLVIVVMAQAYNDNGAVTYQPANAREVVPGSGGVRQVAWAGSFEGASMLGVGLDARRPFSVRAVPGAQGRLIVTIGG